MLGAYLRSYNDVVDDDRPPGPLPLRSEAIGTAGPAAAPSRAERLAEIARLHDQRSRSPLASGRPESRCPARRSSSSVSACTSPVRCSAGPGRPHPRARAGRPSLIAMARPWGTEAAPPARRPRRSGAGWPPLPPPPGTPQQRPLSARRPSPHRRFFAVSRDVGRRRPEAGRHRPQARRLNSVARAVRSAAMPPRLGRVVEKFV